jgi:ABC-2 type transport system permease protein
MASGGNLTAGLDQVTLNWPSPIEIDKDKNKGRKVTPLLRSSARSWTSDSLHILPDFRTHGSLGFKPGEKRGRQVLAVAVEGRFTSYFRGKHSPLIEKVEAKGAGSGATEAQDGDAKKDEKRPVVTGLVDRSPESARIILFASDTFLTDQTLQFAATATRTQYLNPIQLVENAVDWSLEDRGLLGIRSRGHFSRMLESLSTGTQAFWEYLNYGLALLGLAGVYLGYRYSRRRALRHYREVLGQ